MEQAVAVASGKKMSAPVSVVAGEEVGNGCLQDLLEGNRTG